MWEIIIKILVVILITACGMWGGQRDKWVRRYLIPSLSSLYVVTKDKKKKYRASFYLLLMGILSIGYGENSKLRKLLKGSNAWTRIVYGLLVSLPFVFFGKWWAMVVLPIAFSIRAGGFQLPNGKDWLWEDFIRYSSIGVLVVI